MEIWFYIEGGWVTRTNCPEKLQMPHHWKSLQGQVGWGFDQSDLLKDVPAHKRKGVDYMAFEDPFPTQSIIAHGGTWDFQVPAQAGKIAV